MDLYANIVSGFNPLIISPKSSILDVSKGFEEPSDFEDFHKYICHQHREKSIPENVTFCAAFFEKHLQ